MVGVEGSPHRLALRQVFKEIGRISAEVTSTDFLLARRKTGYKFFATRLQNGISGPGRSQRNRGQKVSSRKMAAQFAGRIFPSLIGRHAGGNTRGEAEGMQKPIDRE